MSKERYIAAIEISSSKILAAVGKTTDDGLLQVIAVEQDHGVEGVRYGIIQNLEETSLRVAKVIERLQNRAGIAPRQIKGVFVGLSGRSLKSIPSSVSLNLPDETEITDDILDRLRKEAMQGAIESSLEVVDAVPRIYRVGKTETISPKGNVGNRIEATYDLIVCRPEIKRNLTRTIEDKLGINIEGFVVTALAAGHLLLTSEEKRLGCMLVDMGAETTTVTLYAKGCLRYFATLPFGGRNITRDIQSLSLLEEDAEDIKKTSGNAIPPETQANLNLNGVKLADVSNLLVARAEEIVANIVEQIEYAELKEGEFPTKVVCIGGGARLQNMMELLSSQINLPVKRGVLPKYVSVDDSHAGSYDLEQLISVLYAGATHSKVECLEEPQLRELPPIDPVTDDFAEAPVEEPKAPKQKESKWLKKLQSRMAGLFSNPVDDSDLLE